jgi:predicted nucleic acid-binding Zn ribbon protein
MSNKKSTTCLECQVVFIPKSGSTGKFCNKSCSNTFNNRQRIRTPESRQKTAETLKKKNLIPLKTKSGKPSYSKVSWCKVCNGVIRHDHKLTCSVECKDILYKPSSTKKNNRNSIISNLYPRKYFAMIKYTALYLQKNPDDVTYDDVSIFKDYINAKLHVDNLSPSQIAHELGIVHANFGMFIDKCLGIKLKTVRDAVINTKKQLGINITDEKKLYYQACAFKISKKEMKKIPGFDLLLKLGVYNKHTNKNGVVRDHIISKAEGYVMGYDPRHISHPANCRFISYTDNLTKSSASDITYEQLLERIKQWENGIVCELIINRRELLLA